VFHEHKVREQDYVTACRLGSGQGVPASAVATLTLQQGGKEQQQLKDKEACCCSRLHANEL
jgi:hypothetical protein